MNNMRFMHPKFLRKDNKYIWTNHALQKMCFYRLPESKVKRVIRNPKRIEEGIAMDTIASMQPSRSKKRAEEIWVMWQKNEKIKTKNEKRQFKSKNYGNSKKIIIISAWRYPGISPIGKKIEIPEDILKELRNSGLIE